MWFFSLGHIKPGDFLWQNQIVKLLGNKSAHIHLYFIILFQSFKAVAVYTATDDVWEFSLLYISTNDRNC